MGQKVEMPSQGTATRGWGKCHRYDRKSNERKMTVQATRVKGLRTKTCITCRWGAVSHLQHGGSIGRKGYRCDAWDEGNDH